MAADHLQLRLCAGRLRQTLLAFTVLGLSGLAVLTCAPSVTEMTDLETLAARFCSPLPADAVLEHDSLIDRAVMAEVSGGPVQRTSPPFDLQQRQAVRLTVRSALAGAVGIHGLTDIKPVKAGESVDLPFRAIHGGRFPIHFHGLDGTHFEFGAVEVRPAS